MIATKLAKRYAAIFSSYLKFIDWNIKSYTRNVITVNFSKWEGEILWQTKRDTRLQGATFRYHEAYAQKFANKA